jgi:predicted amidohydrolase
MSTTFKAACVQTNTGPDPEEGTRIVADGIRRARDAGADFITTPENVLMIESRRAAVLGKAEEEAAHRGLQAFRDLARETGAWLLAGSLTVKVEPERVANRSVLFDPQGAVVASYDKMHMFDVDLADGESYRESRTYRPGDAAVMDLAHAGAKMLTVPSAFTRPTGRAHWHVLLRARAIETGCFVVAAAQCGEHAGGRKTYGHSVIIDPWGEVLADGGEEPGFIVADIDLARVDEARRMIPSLQHDRTYAPVPVRARAAE